MRHWPGRGSLEEGKKKAAFPTPPNTAPCQCDQLNRFSPPPVRGSISDIHHLVIQVFGDKVVDRRDIASDGLIKPLACLLFRYAAYGATRERRTLRGITASVIRSYSDA